MPSIKPQNETKKYWRSLEDLSGSPEFEQFLHREFPEAADQAPEGVSRRRWLQVMGASFALGAGAAGCRYPEETIAPFAVRPENRVPGKPQKFATTLQLAGKVCPVVATSMDGRPIKVDGNELHPLVSGSDAFAQASVLQVYDPDRSRSPIERRDDGVDETRSWEYFITDFWKPHAAKLKGADSARLAILHQDNHSPSVLAQMNALAEQFPQARWYKYESISDRTSEGTQKAFGQNLRPQLRIGKADRIVTIGADLLGNHPTSGVNSREFAARRTPESGEMNRLYVVESRFTTTGLVADHRLPLPTSKMASFVAELEQKIDQALDNGPTEQPPEEKTDKLVTAMVNDLVGHQGTSLVVGGDMLDADTQARIWRINSKLKNIGQTVEFVAAPQLQRESVGTIEELTTALKSGEIETIVFLGGNPVYDAPSDLDFASALDQATTGIYYGDYENETSRRCRWHLAASHELEQWGDAIAYDGSFCIAQPLIDPIFATLDPIQVLRILAGSTIGNSLEVVRETAGGLVATTLSETAWSKIVHDGFVLESAAEPVDVSIAEGLELAEVDPPAWRQGKGETLELIFHPSSVYDGRYANNGWLQELPDPITKVTWDNVLTMNPVTADKLGVQQGELVEVTVNGKTVEIPAFLQPGQALGTLAVGLGYGRPHCGMVGGMVEDGVDPVGVDVGPLRTQGTMQIATQVTATPTGKKYPLATTQDHFSIDTLGMEEIGKRVGALVREGTLDEFKAHPDFADHRVHHPPLVSPWTEFSYEGHAWGMSIDLSKCTGCNACTIACQAENNVPIVGKEQVIRGREMHWIRIDRYFSGDPEEPQAVSQPMTCQHCEMAPCESVCPVAATVHSNEGLNDMVYNRCIGTRYCGNNCPYKVRRFNYLDWRANDYRFEKANVELAKLVYNPEVTVRNRGVMEKCTYCVQRIQNTKIEARSERRPIAPNEIKVACQEACSSQAIKFGDLNNPESAAAQNAENPRAYAVLAELNTKPRTRYLARIRNPHEWLAPPVETKHGHGHGEEHGADHTDEHGAEAH